MTSGSRVRLGTIAQIGVFRIIQWYPVAMRDCHKWLAVVLVRPLASDSAPRARPFTINAAPQYRAIYWAIMQLTRQAIVALVVSCDLG